LEEVNVWLSPTYASAHIKLLGIEPNRALDDRRLPTIRSHAPGYPGSAAAELQSN